MLDIAWCALPCWTLPQYIASLLCSEAYQGHLVKSIVESQTQATRSQGESGRRGQAHMSQEDAAALLSEFIYQIDNLPAEVAFILEEIGWKDEKVQGELCRR